VREGSLDETLRANFLWRFAQGDTPLNPQSCADQKPYQQGRNLYADNILASAL
jgi:hypothetical protein